MLKNASEFSDHPPYPFTLGTVQFGMGYGIANRDGRPSYSDICAILQLAHEGGVNTLDTAAGYGESEALLGRALDECGLRDVMRIVTKIAPLPDGLSAKQAKAHILNSANRSLELLRQEQLAACLFHVDRNIVYADELLELKSIGLAKQVGVSFIYPHFARQALSMPELSVWQIPASVLDRRFTVPELSLAAKRAGVTLFARSVYLQGLLLMGDEQTPPHLRQVIPLRHALQKIATEAGLPFAEFLLRAMLGHHGICSLVIGVETVAQLKENLRIVQKGALPNDLLTVLDSAILGVDEVLVNPIKWEQLKYEFSKERLTDVGKAEDEAGDLN